MKTGLIGRYRLKFRRDSKQMLSAIRIMVMPRFQRAATSFARNGVLLIGTLVGMLAVCSIAEAETSLPDLIESVEPSVVRIEVELIKGSSQGSGFLTEKGIVTNHHVIEHAISAKVIFSDQTEVSVTGVRAWDDDRDLAVLAIAGQESRPKLKLSAALPRKGELVVAFGAPRGFSFTTSEGIVSGIRLGAEIRKELDEYTQSDELQWVQTTAPISNGNSGGPLVNSKGEVIGVNTWTHTEGQNLNFALSSLEVSRLLEKVSKEQLTEFSQLPKTSSVAGGGSERRLAQRIFVAVAQPEFESTLKVPVSVAKSFATELKDLYWSETADLEQIKAIESKYHDAIAALSILKNYRPDLRKFLREENSLLGTPGEWYVLQVTGADTMLVQLEEGADEVFCVKGVSTAGIADGISKDFDGLWFTLGETHTYETRLGPRTVYVIRGATISSKELIADFVAATVHPTVDREIDLLTLPEAPKGEALTVLESKRKANVAKRLEAAEKAKIIAQEQEQIAQKLENEKSAEVHLRIAKQFLQRKPAVGQRRLQELVDEFPDTKSSDEARKLLGIPTKGTGANELRTWRSGKFSTEARLIALDGFNVTLEKPDGKRITVSLVKLSEEDQDYIESADIAKAAQR